jgi:antitoxin component HigA of HigAB toxin-antitoxin module
MKLIKTATDHAAALEALEALMIANPPAGSEDSEKIELLGFLIENYELTKNDKDILAELSEHVSLISDANTLRDELGEQSTLLREWMKWADMGIEDLLPKWCAPVLRATYEKTRSILKQKKSQ